jgi:hypothetical protein
MPEFPIAMRPPLRTEGWEFPQCGAVQAELQPVLTLGVPSGVMLVGRPTGPGMLTGEVPSRGPWPATSDGEWLPRPDGYSPERSAIGTVGVTFAGTVCATVQAISPSGIHWGDFAREVIDRWVTPTLPLVADKTAEYLHASPVVSWVVTGAAVAVVGAAVKQSMSRKKAPSEA